MCLIVEGAQKLGHSHYYRDSAGSDDVSFDVILREIFFHHCIEAEKVGTLKVHFA